MYYSWILVRNAFTDLTVSNLYPSSGNDTSNLTVKIDQDVDRVFLPGDEFLDNTVRYPFSKESKFLAILDRDTATTGVAVPGLEKIWEFKFFFVVISLRRLRYAAY